MTQPNLTRTFSAGIEYTDSGAGVFDQTKETIVCLHGIGGDDASFLDQSIHLPNYRVLSWNMPGYGRTPSLQENTFPNLAKALHKLLTELGTGPVHIVGQSIGGMVAQEYACHHSDNIKSLTLVATTSAFGGRDDSFKQAFLAARLKPLDEGKSMQALAEETVPAITAKSVSQRAVDAAVKSMAAVPVKTYTDILKCLVTFDRRAELAKIECPVCLVAGNEDTNAPAVTMKKMADKIEGSEYHEIQDAGHLVNLEKYEEFNAILHQFINKNFS